MPSVIRKGSRGSDVILCQDCLNEHGFPCEIDGIFGPGTEAKVKSFQKANNLTADGVVGGSTWAKLLNNAGATNGVNAPNPLPLVIEKARELGHKVWGDPWRMWFFGIRDRNRNANAFDDTLGCAYVNDHGLWTVHYWPGTTDPGSYWLIHPSNPLGTAILVPGQYLDTWKIDLHGGKYEALCQRAGQVSVYRDASKDEKLDLDPRTVQSGYYGINLHAATQVPSGVSTQVDKWSAGCQVHAAYDGFKQMMDLAKLQVDKTRRDTFSYTLLNKWW